jgi:4-hydroxy-tetrahydrodipicolinate reductase
MDSPIRLGVGGAHGHMGRAVLSLIAGRTDIELTAAFGRPERQGERVDGVALTSAEFALERCEAIIDFSTAEASQTLAVAAAESGAPALIIGATGFTREGEAAIARAAGAVPIVKSGNFSLGVNLMAGLIEQAARRLAADDWDIEIVEAHHRRKIDAPSGTALMLGEAAARGRSRDLADVAVRGRDGLVGPRPHGAIGFAVVRAGGLIGEHSVTLASEDEILTFAHSARDRRLFARGAILAALWVRGMAPRLYDMQDVLGLRN